MIKDWRGTPIIEGSTIVYPGRSGSSLWMTEATVLEIITEIETRRNWHTKQEKTYLKIEAKGTRFMKDEGGEWKNLPHLYKATITAINRVTVVS